MRLYLHALSVPVLLLVARAETPVRESSAPHGRYVEARTASVFAGACHYGGEATTQGREALLAFQFDGGNHDGVDLSGGMVVALVRGDANLADVKGARQSVIYVDQRASAARRAALADTIRERLVGVLGRVAEVRSVDLDLELAIATDRYRVSAPGLFELRGATLPDRACCKMPYNVWYEPFVDLDAPVVGLNTEFACKDREFGAVWSRPDENASFVGSFDFRVAHSD